MNPILNLLVPIALLWSIGLIRAKMVGLHKHYLAWTKKITIVPLGRLISSLWRKHKKALLCFILGFITALWCIEHFSRVQQTDQTPQWHDVP
jgi:hypothetical protein